MAISSLWPENLRVDALSPVAILRAQAAKLEELTQGLLEGKVAVLEEENGNIQIVFDVIAPILGGYRHRILVARHDPQFVYPVTVEAEGLKRRRTGVLESSPSAATQDEFEELVRDALKFPQTRSIIESLVARSNDELAAKAPAEPET